MTTTTKNEKVLVRTKRLRARTLTEGCAHIIHTRTIFFTSPPPAFFRRFFRSYFIFKNTHTAPVPTAYHIFISWHFFRVFSIPVFTHKSAPIVYDVSLKKCIVRILICTLDIIRVCVCVLIFFRYYFHHRN